MISPFSVGNSDNFVVIIVGNWQKDGMDFVMKTTVKIRDINPHIVCSLCAGYFVDATTIVECLHTFCKSCIVKYLQTSVFCPTCSIKIHETQPLLQIRLDRTLQDIVYKLVPGLRKAEDERRKLFDECKGNKASTQSTDNDTDEDVGYNYQNYSNSYRDDEQICLHLKQDETQEDLPEVKVTTLTHRYLRCSIRARVGHLRRVLRKILDTPSIYEIDLYCNDRLLSDAGNMKFVWLAAWQQQVQPMVITYKFRRLVPCDDFPEVVSIDSDDSS